MTRATVRKWLVRGLMGFGGFCVVGALLFVWMVVGRVSDLRPQAIKNGISPAAARRGRALIAEMEKALGGYETWRAKRRGMFLMEAIWHFPDRWLIGWKVNPQVFTQESILGTDDSRMVLWNGPDKKQSWGIKKGRTYRQEPSGKRHWVAHEGYQRKLLYKSYWFQFPFRIREASVVADVGPAVVEGRRYERVFASWGKQQPSRKYDQFVLYIHAKTRQLEWLHFTVREKVPGVMLATRFSDYRKVGGISLPCHQKVYLGSPKNQWKLMHVNKIRKFKWTGHLRKQTKAGLFAPGQK